MSGRIWTVLIGAVVAGTASAQPVRFVEVTEAAGLIHEPGCNEGCTVAIGDYNDDGWLDVCLVGRGPHGIQLYRNNGDKTFTNVSRLVLPADRPAARAVQFIDVDNDGDSDLVVARWYRLEQATGFDCLLNENGVFSPVRSAGPIGRAPGRMGGLALSDVDNDRDLDVVLVRAEGPGTYVRNDGAGGFADMTQAFGANLHATHIHWSTVLADFNNDGLPDLHGAIDYGHDYQAWNNGDGTFTDVSELVGVSNVGNDMGLAVGDIENDGDLDIFSTNILGHVLYVNDGAGFFTGESTTRGVADIDPSFDRFGWGAAFVDLDHDRDLDLIYVADAGSGAVHINDGTGYFTRPDSVPGIDLNAIGMAAFDYDRDGDIDILTTPRRRSAAPRLFENATPSDETGKWLIVKPRGTNSNRDGVNARVYAIVGATTMMREVLAGDSCFASGPHEVHFGLGDAETVDELRVRWLSGVSRTLRGVSVNRVLNVFEPIMIDGRLVGDFDLDCSVDGRDLVVLLEHFGVAGAGPDSGDTDSDADVDLSDLARLLAQFGARCDG